MTWLYLALRKLILPLEEIDDLIPQKGKVIDLGCGQGVIASYLARQSSREVIGIDTDISRLPKRTPENLTFSQENLVNINLPKINGAIISDVLHHLEPEEQKALIKKVYLALEKKGTLVIKEIDTGEIFRSKLSRFWDFVFYPKDKIYFNSARNLKNFLRKTGFSEIKISRPCRFFPGSTTLLECIK